MNEEVAMFEKQLEDKAAIEEREGYFGKESPEKKKSSTGFEHMTSAIPVLPLLCVRVCVLVVVMFVCLFVCCCLLLLLLLLMPEDLLAPSLEVSSECKARVKHMLSTFPYQSVAASVPIPMPIYGVFTVLQLIAGHPPSVLRIPLGRHTSYKFKVRLETNLKKLVDVRAYPTRVRMESGVVRYILSEAGRGCNAPIADPTVLHSKCRSQRAGYREGKWSKIN